MTREQEIEAAWELHKIRDRQWGWVRSLPTLLKDRLCEAQNWRCCYCGVKMEDGGTKPTFEHVIPRSKGGAHEESNLVIACRDCNMKRGNEMWDVHEGFG